MIVNIYCCLGGHWQIFCSSLKLLFHILLYLLIHPHLNIVKLLFGGKEGKEYSIYLWHLYFPKKTDYTLKIKFSLCLSTDMMTMTMVKLTSYWTVALKFISKLLFALLKRLPKECMIASGGSSSTPRRYAPIVACLFCNLAVTLFLRHLIKWLSNLSITSTNLENFLAPLPQVPLWRKPHYGAEVKE